MRILLDQNVPIGVTTLLGAQHDIRTAYGMGWSRLSDADLLQRAEQDGFEVFVSGDRNIPHHVNLTNSNIRLAVLWTTRWLDLRAQPDRVRALVETA